MNMATLIIICIVGFALAFFIAFMMMKKRDTGVNSSPSNIQIIEEETEREVESNGI